MKRITDFELLWHNKYEKHGPGWCVSLNGINIAGPHKSFVKTVVKAFKTFYRHRQFLLLEL